MTELQEKIFEIMKTFDGVCRENGLHYYMLGGTMLGAVRHKGFIPWDDDADFGLPRKAYEQLLKLPESSFPEGYRLRHFSKEAGVPYAFIRLEDERTTCIEARRSGTGYVGGVYIDIFPLDGDGDVLPLRVWKDLRIKFKKKLLYAHIAEKNATKSSVKRLVMKIITKHTDCENLVRSLDTAVRRYGEKNKETTRYSNYLGHWGRRESILRSVFDGEFGSKEYAFEDYRFFGPVDYEAYLTALYGSEYMIPPAEDARGGHPATVIELDRSYHDIKEREKDGGMKHEV